LRETEQGRVVGAPVPGVLVLDEGREVRYDRLILATGARERFLPFPGWTLPNVTGAGGLQALAKSGFPVAGKRVVIAGTGPLLLAVPRSLRAHGANVRLIGEQTWQHRLNRFAMHLARHPGKLIQAIGFRANLLAIPYLTSCWPIGANGKGKIERV